MDCLTVSIYTSTSQRWSNEAARISTSDRNDKSTKQMSVQSAIIKIHQKQQQPATDTNTRRMHDKSMIKDDYTISYQLYTLL